MSKGSFPKWCLLNLAPPAAAFVIRMLGRLMRLETVGGEVPRSFVERGEYPILAFWHDQLLLMVLGYTGPGSKILISASKDGELIARVMHRFGMGAVRGSSNRGGRAAFRELVALGKESVDLVVTPDGPKGPRHQVKDGVVQLARLTGRGVVPMAFACSRGHRFASWDRFLLPYPFCRGVFAFGPPLYHAEGESVEQFRARIQEAMKENLERAESRLTSYGLSAV
ncbi:MAG: hypothetical protein C0617_02195 [Desulfuromonas sp.]|uniref:lysophospholipid acyltransferase family protein n=1 Tax=Desulfuromonas sp. TaxID=892 RepID=UPI000CC2F8F8|nr:lysophospholipid acyltransferase family protein [Desulfuromonas sp.]PLX85972.1 MAG: hypothetical protein C0617_02195 [Desulfuromonas sp.]